MDMTDSASRFEARVGRRRSGPSNDAPEERSERQNPLDSFATMLATVLLP
jgi:hypothetical protein